MFKPREVYTLPNVLSLMRLLLIPVIVWLYCVRADTVLCAAALLLSGLTDVLDGQIARKCNSVTNLGKILDPVADKLTQFAMLLCLSERFSGMGVLAWLLAAKEIGALIMGYAAVRQSRRVLSADWHGKITTVLLYVTIGIHLLWPGIPSYVSGGLLLACIAMMTFSAGQYALRNRRLMHWDESDG